MEDLSDCARCISAFAGSVRVGFEMLSRVSYLLNDVKPEGALMSSFESCWPASGHESQAYQTSKMLFATLPTYPIKMPAPDVRNENRPPIHT